MENNRRIAVIIHTDARCSDNVRKTASMLVSCNMFESVTVYYTDGVNFICDIDGVSAECFPRDLDTEPKMRNWINAGRVGYGGFLHVIKDDTEIVNTPSDFITDVEKMMDVFDYRVWFSTVTDGCNYVYSKYNPRVTIAMNYTPANEKFGFRTDICVTSHSNTYWMIYDMPKLVGSDLIRFDERYTVPMFYIIELLARRRNGKKRGDLYFMNQYLTVRSELGVFKEFKTGGRKNDDIDLMQKEDKVFKDQNVNFAADLNIDTVLETFWEKLAEKTGVSPA